MKFPLVILPLTVIATSFAQTVAIAPVQPDGVFRPGKPITWTVTVTDPTPALKDATYTLKLNGGKVVAEGRIDLSRQDPQIEAAAPTGPATLLAEITYVGAKGKPVTVRGGAVVDPEKIQPAFPRPADFDAFWQNQLAALAEVSANPILVPADSGNPTVDYFKVTLANVNGTKVHVQLARPKSGGKFPGLVLLQWAGVYGLNKSYVVGPASQGWIAINVMPHDLPLDETKEFYKQQGSGPLKDYGKIGNTRRDTSYFLGMFLGAVRAADYLTSRPDWNGKTLVASGGSQGGYLAIMLAALDPRVTAVVANIPAGCEVAGNAADRGAGWPNWLPGGSKTANADAVLAASGYFDTINFASRVRAPTLIGMGLTDVTCPPSGQFAMINQLSAPREIVVMPLAGHAGPHPDFAARSNVWMKALRTEKPVPVPLPPRL